MAWRTFFFGLVSLPMIVPIAFSEEKTLEPLKEELTTGSEREVYFSDHHLVLVENGQMTTFITPRVVSEYGRFQVRIMKPKPEEPADAPVGEPTLASRIEARRIMHAANQAFLKGEIAKTWELVATAEALDPDFYRIKTMKGSLLYKIGSIDLAMEVWQASLALNPNQPEILEIMKNMEATQPSLPTVAKGEAASDKKASLQ